MLLFKRHKNLLAARTAGADARATASGTAALLNREVVYQARGRRSLTAERAEKAAENAENILPKFQAFDSRGVTLPKLIWRDISA
jgi:hypothetical protein